MLWPSCFVLHLCYTLVPLTYFCGPLLDINKMILSYLLWSSKVLLILEFLEFLLSNKIFLHVTRHPHPPACKQG